MLELKDRIILGVVIVLVDFCLWFVPIGSIFIAYVIIAKPPIVKKLFEELYK